MRTDEGEGRLHRTALATVSALLPGIGDAELARPTPCAGWDLRALVAHMAGQNHGFAAALASGDAPAEEYAPRPLQRAADALPVWHESVERLLAASGAADPDRRIRLVEISRDATFAATAVVRIQLLDTVVHTWDLATALGREYRPGADVLPLVAAVARAVPDGPSRDRPGAAFAAPVPAADDDPWVAVLAHLGRRALD